MNQAKGDFVKSTDTKGGTSKVVIPNGFWYITITTVCYQYDIFERAARNLGLLAVSETPTRI